MLRSLAPVSCPIADDTSILEIMIAALKDHASHRVRQQPFIRMIRASADGSNIEIGGTRTIFPSATCDFSKTKVDAGGYENQEEGPAAGGSEEQGKNSYVSKNVRLKKDITQSSPVHIFVQQNQNHAMI